MPTQLSHIYMQLLTGCKHNSTVAHKPEKLAELWNEYISRAYPVSPEEGLSFIDSMLALEPPSTLGQSAGVKRGGIMKEVKSRTLAIEETEELKAMKAKHTHLLTVVSCAVMEEPPTKK